ncbi:MAG: hypothetical protein HC882_04680 [Acidobacteria bacterium]|nr:hypothetical protein [Acidobacteriota bacterium]
MTERAAEAGRTLGLVLGGACVLAGLGLAAFYAFVWMSPESAPIPFVPFFDKPRLWRSGFLLASASVAVSLLAIVGTLLLRRARLAPLAFLLAGWGGLAVTIAGLWPGRRVSFMLQTAVSQAERAGRPRARRSGIWCRKEP